MTGTATSGRPFAADPIVAAPGPLPPAWVTQLVSCVVDENVGLPDAAVLTYRDPNHELLADTGITIGTRLRVSVATVAEGGQELLFAGEVTALELDSDTTGSYTVIRALSQAHRLFRGRKVVAFRNMTADDIVKKVAVGAKLKVGRIEAAPITYTQRTQVNQSDWEFLQDLAQEHGATVRVDRDGTLSFTKPKPASTAPSPGTKATQSPFVLEYGRNLMVLRAVLTSSEQVGNVEVRGWDVTTKRPVVGTAPATSSKTVLPGLRAVEATRSFGTATLLATDTPYGTQAETEAAAESLAESVSTGFAEIEAVVEGNPELRAGTPVTLGNAGPAFSGRYTATAAHHVLEPGAGYRTTVLVSASPDRSLSGLVTGPNAPARGPRVAGLATGIVTDTKEPNRGGRGWVRLRFPWLSQDYVTDWVRSVQFGGSQGGGVFSPEVNDEVLVGFDQGCLDRPYVIGGLYNGVDKPSPHDVALIDGTNGNVNRRSFVSPEGHRIELLDAQAGPKGVRLASGDSRLEIKLDQQNGSIDVAVCPSGGGKPLTSISLTSKGITIDAGTGQLALRAGSVSVESTADLQVKAGKQAELQGASVSVKGTTAVQIDGGMQAALKGRIVRIN